MKTSLRFTNRYSSKMKTESNEEKKLPAALQSTISMMFSSPDKNTTQTQETKMKNLSILIVDDEQYICDFLSEFLSEKGYNVITVCSGNEAISLITRKSFDLVLCDMVMPETSGKVVIKALDILDERPKVGVITGWSSKMGQYNHEGLNADFILTKPFDLSELSKQINALFPVN